MRLLAFAFISGLVATASAQKVERVSPPLENPFTVPLNIPPVKQPLTSYTDPETGTPIDFYLLAATPFTKKLYPDIPGPGASLVGYDGMEPGPRFLVRKGRETVVRVVNQNYVADGGNGRVTAMHLHGSYSECRSKSIRLRAWGGYVGPSS